MRRYETISIIRPTIGDEEIDAINQRSVSILESDGGSLVSVDKWGLKTLAYLIKKEQQGYYVYMDYAATADAVSEIERQFRIDDRVLKFMTVKLQDVFDPDSIEEERAAAAQAAASRAAESEDEDVVSSDDEDDDDDNDDDETAD